MWGVYRRRDDAWHLALYKQFRLVPTDWFRWSDPRTRIVTEDRPRGPQPSEGIQAVGPYDAGRLPVVAISEEHPGGRLFHRTADPTRNIDKTDVWWLFIGEIDGASRMQDVSRAIPSFYAFDHC